MFLIRGNSKDMLVRGIFRIVLYINPDLKHFVESGAKSAEAQSKKGAKVAP